MVRLFLFVVGIMIWSFCPGQIHGVVVDEHGESIPGATVQLAGGTQGTVTDAQGYFQLWPAEGSGQLVVRSVGFKMYQMDFRYDGKVLALGQIALRASDLNLESVVVTGTLTPVSVSASPVKIEVLTSKHFNTYLPAAASSVMDGIKLINGVQEVVACGVCFTNNISLNGLPGPYTSVLLDGSPVYGSLASVYGLNGIPNMIIDRLEVIKGPNSTLYGSEAMAGVINVITKDPETQPTFSLDWMGTTHTELFGSVGYTYKGDHVSGFTGLNVGYIGEFQDKNHDGFSDVVNMDRWALFSKWKVKMKKAQQLSIAAKLYYEDRRNGVEDFLENRNYRTLRGSASVYGESIYTRRAEIFGTYQFVAGSGLKLDYSLSHHDQDSYYGADRYIARQQIAFSNLIWSHEWRNHQVVSGLTNRFQYYDDNTVATREDQSNQPERQWIPGVFVQDEWQLTSALSILSGLRLDHYGVHGPILSPRLSAKWKSGQWTTFRTNLGTGFRVVNLFSEDHAFVTGQRQVLIIESLNPERSMNGSANANHVFTWGQSQGMLDIDVFYSLFTNKIIPDYDQPGLIVYANAPGHATSRGLGLNWSQEFAIPFSFTSGFTVQRSEMTEWESGNKVRSPLPFAPLWSAVMTANYEMKALALQVGWSARVTGPMYLPEVYDLDVHGMPLPEPRALRSNAFMIHNIQFTRTMSKKLQLYGGVQNLFNYWQPESPMTGYNDPNYPIGFSPSFDTSYAYAPINGREFYLGIQWSF